MLLDPAELVNDDCLYFVLLLVWIFNVMAGEKESAGGEGGGSQHRSIHVCDGTARRQAPRDAERSPASSVCIINVRCACGVNTGRPCCVVFCT